MAVDYFLKIDGVPGESTDSKHKNEIEVVAFSWGATNQAGLADGGGSGAGKGQVQDFHFTMRVNKASPKLMLACIKGEHLKTATLTCRKAGKDQQEFLVYKFTDVTVSSFQTGGGSGDATPMDSVSLAFSKFELEYKPEKADGSLGQAMKTGWDLKQGKKV
jgi:type VI secretion system secreted protein Hcp